MQIITASGSIYHIDPKAKTWRRAACAGSGHIRTESGTYNHIHYFCGEPLTLICDPINPAAHARVIETSPITEIIEDENTEAVRDDVSADVRTTGPYLV